MSASYSHLSRKKLIFVGPFLAVVFAFGLYVVSILWRVGMAEQELFGRNYVIPYLFQPRQYDEPATAESHGDSTYSFVRNGTTVHVYKQMINGFQHTLGSAIAAFELGECAADLLFRANEYAEAAVCHNAAEERFMLDTKKDLANNWIGREIGKQARARHLTGAVAEKFLVEQTLHSVHDGTLYSHWNDPRVAQLPSLDKSGCPLLREIQLLHGR